MSKNLFDGETWEEIQKEHEDLYKDLVVYVIPMTVGFKNDDITYLTISPFKVPLEVEKKGIDELDRQYYPELTGIELREIFAHNFIAFSETKNIDEIVASFKEIVETIFLKV
ncbi:hypothetical protein [Lactococcus lactis]|uniref:Uncharacterized protein n=1 Tax=Lactococcus lactis TaxID=1358 RepID=A0AAW5TTT3_9LACT|nr:hypothetical protein [Lactococcus lactis]MCW2281956.1 hypothetical protein [Lactococcus lactis]